MHYYYNNPFGEYPINQFGIENFYNFCDEGHIPCKTSRFSINEKFIKTWGEIKVNSIVFVVGKMSDVLSFKNAMNVNVTVPYLSKIYIFSLN
jgi:hypothetical protein